MNSVETRMLLAALVVWGVLGRAAPAAAYRCSASTSGPSLFWNARSIDMAVHVAGGAEVSAAEVSEAAVHAARQWSNEAVACSDFTMSILGTTTEARAHYDWSEREPAVNTIVFRQGTGPASDAWLHPATAIAITTATYVRSTGEILDADIEFNDVQFEFSACEPGASGCVVRHDLKNVMTHEFGHVLGLDHPSLASPGAREATMFESSTTGDVTKRDLADDDVAGLCFLYPEGQAAPGACYDVERHNPPAVRVSKAGCSAAHHDALWLLALLAVTGVRPKRGSWRTSPFSKQARK